MEGLLSVLLFGLGAAAGVKAVEAAQGGVRPILREAMKGGIIATEVAQSLVARAGSAVESAAGGLRPESPGLQTLTESTPTTGRERSGSGPRRIEISKE